MLESKKRMSQYYSDLKSALEKGKGDPEAIFRDFEKNSRDFLGETGKVPREVGNDFLQQAARVVAITKAGDLAGALEEYGTLLRALELPYRPDGHRGRFIRKGEADFTGIVKEELEIWR